MTRDLGLFIEDILKNIELIEGSTANLSEEDFKLDKLIIDATVRRLEIIGEAIKNLPDWFRSKYPEIPWRNIAGARDIFIHGYFQVNLEKIWDIIQNNLPNLKQKIQKIKKDMEF